MIVCPVCEHPQEQGDVCDLCGKQLVAAWGAPDAPVVPMAGLEQTELEGASAPAAPVSPMADLEGTRLAAGGPDLPVPLMQEIDRAPAPVGDVPILPLDQFDSGRAEDDGVRTQLPEGRIVCRYCRTEQAVAAFCERCGMRLPTLASVSAGVRAPRAGDEVWGTCTKCGSRAMVGRKCAECGIVMTMPEA